MKGEEDSVDDELVGGEEVMVGFEFRMVADHPELELGRGGGGGGVAGAPPRRFYIYIHYSKYYRRLMEIGGM